jgi:hypothetical protein
VSDFLRELVFTSSVSDFFADASESWGRVGLGF